MLRRFSHHCFNINNWAGSQPLIYMSVCVRDEIANQMGDHSESKKCSKVFALFNECSEDCNLGEDHC